jgi:hypothetical protein
MSEALAFRQMNEPVETVHMSTRRVRRAPPMGRMTASFERDNMGREMITVHQSNPAYGEIAGKKDSKKVSEVPVAEKPTVGAVLKKASQKAFRGGAAGFAAGVLQVGTFMWMRTVMNVQYAGNRAAAEEAKRAGLSAEALKALTEKEASKAKQWLDKLASMPAVEAKEAELKKAAGDKLAAANAKLCGKTVQETMKNIYAAGALKNPGAPIIGGIGRFYSGVSLARRTARRSLRCPWRRSLPSVRC